MSYNATKPVLLSSRETYELYEKRTITPPRGGYIPAPTQPLTPVRTTSTFPGDPKPGFCGGPYIAAPPPKSHSPSVRFDDSLNVDPQPTFDGQYSVQNKRDNQGNFTQKISAMFPSLKKDDGIPLGWIICIAITVPLFVMVVLFAAVWLQELGML